MFTVETLESKNRKFLCHFRSMCVCVWVYYLSIYLYYIVYIVYSYTEMFITKNQDYHVCTLFCPSSDKASFPISSCDSVRVLSLETSADIPTASCNHQSQAC